MILCFASFKGGTGKTTHAANAAVLRAMQGRRVLIIDMDAQGSLQLFHEARTELAPDAPKLHFMTQVGHGAKKRILDFVGQYDDLVLDTRGSETLNIEMREALLVADKVITPVKPSIFDSATVLAMAKEIRDVQTLNEKLRAYILFNECPTNAHDAHANDARAEFNDIPGFNGVMETEIAVRQIYRTVGEKGQGVIELARTKKQLAARVEMESFGYEVWQ